MLKDELLELIANGENSGIEFKRDDMRPEDLAKEIVALANFQGGRIFIGVEDDGTISGIQRSNLEEWVMIVFRDKIHPMILPYYEEVLIEKNRKVAIISFPQGITKPYVVRHKGREDIYIRVGSTSQLASREQQARLYAIGGMLHTELMPVPGTNFSSMDKARLDNYLKDILHDPDIPKTVSEWEIRLSRLGIMVETIDGKMLCTIAGLVLFGIKPRRYLRQSGLRIMAFSGKDKEYKAKLDITHDAPLVGRWDTNGEKTLIDPGIVEHFLNSITPFISQESGTVSSNMRREKEWFYPLEVLREAVLNALAHRDWTRSVDIEIVSYSDRLEIMSPGSLQNDMTVEKMKAGQRSPRNIIIMEVLRDYGYVDFRGMGVRTKIIPLMKAQNHAEPVFEATEDYMKVILPRKKK
ncbi:MAG: RNA-binding domain-containing protein [bacterium]